MALKDRGFTIVELLIVIVVTVIIASISVTAYAGIQSRTNNSARYNEISHTAKLLETYKATNGSYPALTANKRLCVGTNYPGNRCKSSYSSTDGFGDWDTELTTKLATVGTVPSRHYIVNGWSTGPYVEVWNAGGFSLVMYVEGEAIADCPAQTPDLWWNDPNSSTLMCGKNYSY